ncbi:MAG TPA: hypothetical protein VN688_11340 [Gemmataceae bacterium]|nr:hypothetical protein [Gemmataceae bacterium]
MESRAAGLLLILLILTVAAVAVLVAEGHAERRREARAEEFQQLVGGLGFGPATDLSNCVFAFDPRLEGSCSLGHGLIPGGACFCLWHAGSLLPYPPLDVPSDHRPSGEEDGDASPP